MSPDEKPDRNTAGSAGPLNSQGRIPGYPLEDDNYCFVCGKKNPIGLKLDIAVHDGRTYAEFVLQKPFQGYKDIIHGGIISSILDEVMIHAALASGIKVVTAEMNVRFKSPLLAGEKAFVEAGITRSGKRLVEAAAFITTRDKRIIAEGQCKLMVTGG